MTRLCTIALFAFLALPQAALAQEDGDVLERLRLLAESNGKLYIEPVSKGLGMALNQGALFTARPQGMLHFDVGLAIAGSLIPEEADLFDPVLPSSITVQGQTFSDPYVNPGPTPTATGSGDGKVAVLREDIQQQLRDAGQDPDDYRLTFPGGFDIPAIPFAVLQASAGLPLGTEISLRMIPEVTVADEVGAISAFGFGIKHSVSQYLPGSPVDVAVTFNRQGVDVGDYLEGAATTFGLAASKSLGPLTVFAAAATESGSVDARYTFESTTPGEPGETVSFDTEIESGTRFTGGATLGLLWLKLSAAYSVADYNGFAIKALLSFP